MELDDLKAAWKEYDIKLQSTYTISDKIISSMIKEKSQSRLSKVKRHYLYGIFYMMFWLFAGLAVLVGNPFDYIQTLEYLPMALYCLCMSILIFAMIQTNNKLRKVEINYDTIETSLNKIIAIVETYEKPNKLLGWTLKLLLTSTTVLIPLSFLPRKIERAGLWGGVLDTIIPIAISVILVFIAFKLGAFKEKNGKRFKEYLQELKELKDLSQELKMN